MFVLRGYCNEKGYLGNGEITSEHYQEIDPCPSCGQVQLCDVHWEEPRPFDDGDIDEVRIKTAQLYDFKNGNPLMPENEKYSRYRLQSNGTYKLKYDLGDHCWRMWSSCVLTWDAQVVPCCFDKDAHYQLGDAAQRCTGLPGKSA